MATSQKTSRKPVSTRKRAEKRNADAARPEASPGFPAAVARVAATLSWQPVAREFNLSEIADDAVSITTAALSMCAAKSAGADTSKQLRKIQGLVARYRVNVAESKPLDPIYQSPPPGRTLRLQFASTTSPNSTRNILFVA